MRNLDWYIDEARRVGHVPSDGKLALSMGMARVSVNHWRQRKAWPSPENMIELAKVAGVDPAVALIDLEIWKSKEKKVSDVWTRVASLVATLALPLLFVLTPMDQAQASVTAEAQGASHCIL